MDAREISFVSIAENVDKQSGRRAESRKHRSFEDVKNC